MICLWLKWKNACWSMLIHQAQDSFKSRQNRRISIFLYAQFDYWLWYYGSWLLWWFLCEYCVNNFLTSMQNIVGRLWLKVEYKIKQDQLYMGNYHQLSVSLGLPSIIMRPTCGQDVANMLPCIVFLLSFRFLSHPHT